MILTPKYLRVANLAFLFIISFYLKVVESPAAHALPRFAAVIGDACTGAGQGTCDTDELCVAGICQGNNCGNGIVDSQLKPVTTATKQAAMVVTPLAPKRQVSHVLRQVEWFITSILRLTLLQP